MWYMTACTKSSSRVCLLLLGAKWTTCIKPSTVISEIQSILHLPVDLHPPWLVQNAPFRKSPRAPTFSRIQLLNCSAGNLDFSLCPSTTPRGRGPRMDRCHTVPRQPGGPHTEAWLHRRLDLKIMRPLPFPKRPLIRRCVLHGFACRFGKGEDENQKIDTESISIPRGRQSWPITATSGKQLRQTRCET